jgi:hypothetical protein
MSFIITTHASLPVLAIYEADQFGRQWLLVEPDEVGYTSRSAREVVAVHETREAAEAALAQAKLVEAIWREAWQRTAEHAASLHATMIERMHAACQPKEAE